jgi:hypothetical protein
LDTRCSFFCLIPRCQPFFRSLSSRNSSISAFLPPSLCFSPLPIPSSMRPSRVLNRVVGVWSPAHEAEGQPQPRHLGAQVALVQLEDTGFHLPVFSPRAARPFTRKSLLPIYDSSRTPGAFRLGIQIPWSYQLLGLDRLPRKRAVRRAAFLAREVPNPILKARKYEAALASGSRSYREVAQEFGVTAAEICQYIALVRRLPADLVRKMETEKRPDVLRRFSYRKLLAIARRGACDRKDVLADDEEPHRPVTRRNG